MRKFCPACGRETSEFYENLCKDCFLAKTSIIKIPAKFNVFICPNCSSVKMNGLWKRFDSKAESLNEVVKKNAQLSKGTKLEIWGKGKTSGNQIAVIARAILKIGKKQVIEEKPVLILMKHQVCPNCSAVPQTYYEAVLQLRGSEEKIRDMQSRIEKKIGEMKPLHKGAFISAQGIKKVSGGIDIRIGSKEIAWKLAMDIKSLYKTEIKKSYTLVGARQGSRIYRTTILMRARE